jgi:hypothetical protein
VTLLGPLPPDTSWQAGDDTAVDLTRFVIDGDARHVVCPRAGPAATGSPLAAAMPAGHDVHHARYRGTPKTFLQHTRTAMARNLIRLDAWRTGAATTRSWTSRLARLTQALPAT